MPEFVKRNVDALTASSPVRLAERQPGRQGAFVRVAQHLHGVAGPLGHTRARPHAAGVAAQDDRRRPTSVEQDRGVAAQAPKKVLDLVGCVVAALEDLHLVFVPGVGQRRAGRARARIVQLPGVAGGQQLQTADGCESASLVQQALDDGGGGVVVVG